jgi:hypothetical protein
MKSTARRSILSPVFSKYWFRVGSILVILELWQRYLHPLHGATGQALLVIFGVSGCVSYLIAIVSGSKFISSYLEKRRKSIEFQ